jgi:hypothetical protein
MFGDNDEDVSLDGSSDDRLAGDIRLRCSGAIA